jgi:hypothetical protein
MMRLRYRLETSIQYLEDFCQVFFGILVKSLRPVFPVACGWAVHWKLIGATFPQPKAMFTPAMNTGTRNGEIRLLAETKEACKSEIR